jgi:hypothetical protein
MNQPQNHQLFGDQLGHRNKEMDDRPHLQNHTQRSHGNDCVAVTKIFFISPSASRKASPTQVLSHQPNDYCQLNIAHAVTLRSIQHKMPYF